MFLVYTDASVQEKQSYLAFVVVFEDKRIIKRRIIIDETDSNVAEALALSEALSFLQHHNLSKGIILFDSNGLKSHLKKSRGKVRGYLPKNIKRVLRTLEVRTQVIHRKYNIAHQISYLDEFSKSNAVSEINRSIFSNVPNFPEYFMQPSVLEEYRNLYNKRFASFHEAQQRLNKKIWLADLVEEHGDFKVYENHDKRIKVYKDTIIKLSRENYVRISNHWRVFRRGKKLNKLLEG